MLFPTRSTLHPFSSIYEYIRSEAAFSSLLIEGMEISCFSNSMAAAAVSGFLDIGVFKTGLLIKNPLYDDLKTYHHHIPVQMYIKYSIYR